MRTYSRKKAEPQEVQNVLDLCRLCLGKSSEMMPIFGEDTTEVFATLAMRILMCLGLEVTREDEYPKHICQCCNSQLHQFYIFKKNCFSTYQKLKANFLALKKAQNKKTDEEPTEKELELFSELKPITDGYEKAYIQSSESICQDSVDINIAEMKNEDVKSNTIDDPLSISNLDFQSKITFKETPTNESVDSSKFETQKTEEQAVHKGQEIIVEDILSTYLVEALVENGVLARRGENLEILNHDIKTFKLLTAYGSPVIMELVEQEAEIIKESKIEDAPDPHRCTHCGAQFSSQRALMRHGRSHSGEKPFSCRTCSRSFAQREVLRRHELLHADQLPYQCSECPKAYTQRGALLAHSRVHSSSVPLTPRRCPLCPKAFLYSSGLSRHMSMHQGRKYSCEECPRVFRDRSSLVRHLRAHMRRPRPPS